MLARAAVKEIDDDDDRNQPACTAGKSNDIQMC